LIGAPQCRASQYQTPEPGPTPRRQHPLIRRSGRSNGQIRLVWSISMAVGSWPWTAISPPWSRAMPFPRSSKP